MLKFFSTLIFIFVSIGASARPFHEVLKLSGIYELNITYHSERGKFPVPQIDRLVVLFSAATNTIDLGFTRSESMAPMIHLAGAKWELNPATGRIHVYALGGRGGFRGETQLEFDPVGRTFTGFFIDSPAAGYKELSGKAISTVGDFVAGPQRLPADLDLEGYYEEVGGQRSLTIRNFSDGSTSVYLGEQNSATLNPDNFDAAFYVQELGVLVSNDLSVNNRKAVRVLIVAAQEMQPDGVVRVQAELISTTGSIKKFQFQRKERPLNPPSWRSLEDQLKEQVPQLRTSIVAALNQGQMQPYNGQVEAGTPTAILSSSQDSQPGYATFFVGARSKYIPRIHFLSFLDHHVNLVKDLFQPQGLRGYFVLASQDFEVAILQWDSKEAADRAFQQVGEQVTEDAAKFLKTIVWEELDLKSGQLISTHQSSGAAVPHQSQEK